MPREGVPRSIKPGVGQGAESEAPKEYCIAINNLVNVGIWNKFMNFIFGMRKYFRNSGFLKILYGYSKFYMALFLCIYVHFRRCCTHFCFCCKCCMGMQHVQHVACVACEWTIHELHMQHVQHVACNIFSHIFHCCILVQHQLYT